jgi:hypothetical protein
MGNAAADNKRAKQHENPVKRHVFPLIDNINQRERYQKISHGYQTIGQNVQPH